jgi:hypothetical protein
MSGKPSLSMRDRDKIVKMVCSINDPFCKEAKGARWPDSNNSTITCQLRYFFTLATNASGEAACGINPNFPYGFFSAPTITTGSYTVPNLTAHTFPVWFTSACDQYRPVSVGVSATVIANATAAQGYVTVNDVASLIPASEININTIQPTSLWMPMLPGKAATWTMGKMGIEGDLFTTQNGASAAGSNDRSACTIHVMGGPVSTPVLLLEVVMNMEGIPKPDGAYSNLANTQTSVVPPGMLNTLQAMPIKERILEGGKRVVEAYVAKQVNNFITTMTGVSETYKALH